jgi:hypothetical protein
MEGPRPQSLETLGDRSVSHGVSEVLTAAEQERFVQLIAHGLERQLARRVDLSDDPSVYADNEPSPDHKDVD